MNRTPKDDLTLDFAREARIGIEEAIFCQGKADEHLVEILMQAERSAKSLLLTRMSLAQLDMLPPTQKAQIDYDPISRTGIWGKPRAVTGETKIAIVTAGTSDAFVSREAARTLAYHGVPSSAFMDVGVAGLWRLLDRIDEIKKHPIVIVCAGMDAALPTVMGGLVSGVVLAVPTSVGYGVAAGGETALRAILATCSAGVVVTNIDNGFGAACAALRTLRVMGIR
jgi:pyridinium-3,5-biscarboxylic acid mononucleotide synthase